jgi:hypothetical protein
LTTLPLSCVHCLEIWEPQTPETLRACPGQYVLWLAIKMNMQHINVIVLHFTCPVLYVTKEQNVTNLQTNPVKYATPVEMQIIHLKKKVEHSERTP